MGTEFYENEAFAELIKACSEGGAPESDSEASCFYEEQLMCELYTHIEENYGYELIPSVQMGRGCVDAYKDGQWVGKYDFAEETDMMRRILGDADPTHLKSSWYEFKDLATTWILDQI